MGCIDTIDAEGTAVEGRRAAAGRGGMRRG